MGCYILVREANLVSPNQFLRIQSPFQAKSPFFDWSHPNSFEYPPVITPGSYLWLIFPWQPTFVDGFPRFSQDFPMKTDISWRDFPIFSQVPVQSSIAFISGAGVLQRSMRGDTFEGSFHFRWCGIQYTCIYYIHIQYIISFSDCASLLSSMWWCLHETNLEYPASIYIYVNYDNINKTIEQHMYICIFIYKYQYKQTA